MRKHHFSPECTGHIVTINYNRANNPDRWVPQAPRKPAPYERTPRNQIGRERWIAYLKRCIAASEPVGDHEVDGQISFNFPKVSDRHQRRRLYGFWKEDSRTYDDGDTEQFHEE